MGIDIPPPQQERIVCSIQAASKYDFDPIILLAVSSNENGKPGQWVKNKNGTHDVGPMQLNTAYLATLAKHGITAQDAAKPGCYSYYLAAWRIKGHIVKDRSGDIWTKVANYHSYTPVHNKKYRQKLIVNAERWVKWFQQRGYNISNIAFNSEPVKNNIQPSNITVTYSEPKTRSSVIWKAATPTIKQ